MGLEILRQLRNLPSTTGVASEWVSAYTGIQVISNRLTPGHRDSKGRPEWYDLLTSIGGGSLPHLRVNDIGLQLAYHPGTLVGVCGTIFEHEVRAWGYGDRVCYAHFMRDAVRKRLGVTPAGWVMQNTYGRYLPPAIATAKKFIM
jgi:hypothetical protein